MRQQLERHAVGSGLTPPTVNDLVLRAAALALRQTPQLNACLDGSDLVYLEDIDVGLAVGGSGADVAAEAGDVVLMLARPQSHGAPSLGEPLRSLPLLLRLSRETVRIIRQNIVVFAFGVNAVGIVFTAWLWPLLAPAHWYEQGPVAAWCRLARR